MFSSFALRPMHGREAWARCNAYATAVSFTLRYFSPDHPLATLVYTRELQRVAWKLRPDRHRLCEKVKNLSQMNWSSTTHTLTFRERNKNECTQDYFQDLVGCRRTQSDGRRLRTPCRRSRWRIERLIGLQFLRCFGWFERNGFVGFVRHIRRYLGLGFLLWRRFQVNPAASRSPIPERWLWDGGAQLVVDMNARRRPRPPPISHALHGAINRRTRWKPVRSNERGSRAAARLYPP
jgi:hypothetical protein